MSTDAKGLRLSRETVRELSETEMGRVAGREASLLTCPLESVCELVSLLTSCELIACALTN